MNEFNDLSEAFDRYVAVKKENKKIRELLQEYQLQNINLREDIIIKKISLPSKEIKDKSFWNLYDMPTYEELVNKIKIKDDAIDKVIKMIEPFAEFDTCTINGRILIKPLEILKEVSERVQKE